MSPLLKLLRNPRTVQAGMEVLGAQAQKAYMMGQKEAAEQIMTKWNQLGRIMNRLVPEPPAATRAVQGTRRTTTTPAPVTAPRNQPAAPAASPAAREEYVQLGLLRGQPGIPKYRYEAGTRASNLPLTKAGQPPKVGGQPYDPSLQTYGFAGGRPGTPAIQGPRGMVTRGGQQVEGGGLPVGPSPNLSLDEAVQRGLVSTDIRNPSLPVNFGSQSFTAPPLRALGSTPSAVVRPTSVPAKSFVNGPQAPIPAWDMDAIRRAQGQGTVDALENLASRYSAYYNKPVSAVQLNTPGFLSPRSAAMQQYEALKAARNPALIDAAQSFRVPRLGVVDPKAAAAVAAGAGISAGPAWYFLSQGGSGTNTSPTVNLTDASPAASAGAAELDRAQQESAIRRQAEAEAARRAGLDPGNLSTDYGAAPPAPILPAPQGSVVGQPGSGQVVIRMNDGDSVLRQAAANAQAGAATFQPTAGSYQNARDYYAARAGYTAQPGVMSNVMERLVQQDPRMGQADMQAWAQANPALAYQMLQNSLPRGASQQTQNMQGAEITTELGTNTQNNMVGNTNEAVAAAQGASPDLKAATDPQLRVSLQPVPRDLQAFYNRTGARFANASFR